MMQTSTDGGMFAKNHLRNYGIVRVSPRFVIDDLRISALHRCQMAAHCCGELSSHREQQEHNKVCRVEPLP